MAAREKRNEYYRKAARAYSRGGQFRGAIAAFYADEGRAASTEAQDAQEGIVQRLFEQQRGKWTIDLHGLKVIDVLGLVQLKLDEWLAAGMPTRLCIITGKGSHSEDGRSRLLPVVQQLVKTYRLRATSSEVQVTITGKLPIANEDFAL